MNEQIQDIDKMLRRLNYTGWQSINLHTSAGGYVRVELWNSIIDARTGFNQCVKSARHTSINDALSDALAKAEAQNKVWDEQYSADRKAGLLPWQNEAVVSR